MNAKRSLLDLMGDEINKDIYRDWLFVLGTAIAATKLTRTVCGQCSGEVSWIRDPGAGKTKPVCNSQRAHSGTKEVVEGALVDNIALIQKEKERYVVAKELISGVDYITNKGTKDKVRVRNEQLEVIRHKHKGGETATALRPKFQDERMGGGVFNMDGVTIGIEVCLDHVATASGGMGRLANTGNIQVHLIPSAGMWINAARTKPGGIVFNVDGTVLHVQVIGSGAKPRSGSTSDSITSRTSPRLTGPMRRASLVGWARSPTRDTGRR